MCLSLLLEFALIWPMQNFRLTAFVRWYLTDTIWLTNLRQVCCSSYLCSFMGNVSVVFFPPLVDLKFFLFLIGFLQFNCNVPCVIFLHVWDLLSFLKLGFLACIKFGKFGAINFSNIFFCFYLPSSGTLITCVY